MQVKNKIKILKIQIMRRKRLLLKNQKIKVNHKIIIKNINNLIILYFYYNNNSNKNKLMIMIIVII